MKGDSVDTNLLKAIPKLNKLSAKKLLIFSATLVTLTLLASAKDILKLILEHKLLLAIVNILLFTLMMLSRR
jgi:hypothetical protein